MGEFYREVSRCYHQLFPARPAQLKFLASLAGPPPARVVDVASGTGEYVAALHDRGFDAFGIEVDFHMVRAAHSRHPDIERRLIHGDMLELMDELRGPCSLAFCIGNSLPHLSGLAEVREAVAQMWDITGPGGTVAIQVVNFDRVLKSAQPERAGGAAQLVFELPSLSASEEAGGIVELDRRYSIPHRRAGDRDSDVPARLEFASELRHGGKSVTSALSLQVLTKQRLARCLPEQARVRWLGDFEGHAWSAESPATIGVLSR